MNTLVTFLILLTQSVLADPPKKVLMVINEGFQIDEYFTPKTLFEKAGFKVITASRYGGLVKPGKKYQSTYPAVQADLNFEEIQIQSFDAISFTGGGGAWSDYFPNRTLHHVLIDAEKRKNIVVGLICAGAGLLASADNLDGTTPHFKGRHVTGYPEVAGLLKTLGKVQYEVGETSKPFVIEDGNLITGRDPQSAQLYAEKIIEKLIK